MSSQINYDDDLRTLLMGNIPTEYVQTLRNFPSNSNQLAGDLLSLNQLEQLKSGAVPMQIWLRHAEEEFAGRVEAQVFRRALEEMAAGPAESSDVGPIVVGIEALWEIIRDNAAARDTVVLYHGVFQTALWEIDVIADYKVMHDALHQQQLTWPDSSVVATLLSMGPSMQSTFTNNSGSLHAVVAELLEIYEKSYVDGAERAWIEKLDAEQKKLDALLEEYDTQKIEEAFETVKNELTFRLSALNTRLKAAITRLHLQDLVGAMGKVAAVFRQFAPEPSSRQVAQYEESIEKLNLLDKRLTELITKHDTWQGIDTLLRTLGDTLKRNSDPDHVRSATGEKDRLSQLKFVLTIIENSVTPFYKDRGTFWSKKLTASAQRFKREVEEKMNTDMAEQEFDTYREQAWHFFFELDAEMKEQCEELRKIGDMLRRVNDELKVTGALGYL